MRFKFPNSLRKKYEKKDKEKWEEGWKRKPRTKKKKTAEGNCAIAQRSNYERENES